MAFQPVPTYADPVIVDQKTGKSAFNPVWLQWFLNLSTGGLSGTVSHNGTSGLQGGTTGQYYHLTSTQYTAVVYRNTTATSTLTPSGSPYTYTNADAFDEDIIVQGGTVTKIEFGRSAVFTDVGLTSGMYRLSIGDSIRLTYAVAPTVTKVPR